MHDFCGMRHSSRLTVDVRAQPRIFRCFRRHSGKIERESEWRVFFNYVSLNLEEILSDFMLFLDKNFKILVDNGHGEQDTSTGTNGA